MTTNRQRVANRANAAKSTGPRSSAGKKKASLNALAHGLTTAPQPRDVLRWLRIIVGDIHATPGSVGVTPLGAATLALAEAEAQLERIRDAEKACLADLRKYTLSHLETDPMKIDTFDFDDPAVLTCLLAGRQNRDTKRILRLLLKLSQNGPKDLTARLERTERYARRAEMRKRKAFAVWDEVSKGNLQNEAIFNQ